MNWNALVILLFCFLQGCSSAENDVNSTNARIVPFQKCKVTVLKDKISSRGIASKVLVKIERSNEERPPNSTISIIYSGGNSSRTQHMDSRGGSVTEFQTEITTQSLGRSYYNVCVSDCSICKELVLFSIPAPLTLLPPVLTVLLAIISKQVLLSLTCGVFSAAVLSSAYNPVDAFITTLNSYIILPFIDPSKAGVIIFSCLMGGLIEVMGRSGGAKGFTDKISRFASTTFHASAITIGVSLAFFFDDYASIMICGRSLGSLVSVLGLSKQKFSLIVHMMAVIVTSLCPLSSWAGIQIGYIESAFKLTGVEVSGFSYLVQSIPYRFFVVTAFLSVIIYVLINRDIVPMITYEEEQLKSKATEEELDVTSDLTSSLSDEGIEEDKENDKVRAPPERWFNAIIPLIVLVGVSLLRMYYDGKEAILASGEDIPLTFINCASRCNSINCLVIGTAVSFLLTLVLLSVQRIMGLSKCMKHFVEGVKSMSEPNMILILAWSLGEAMNDIHTSEYIALALGQSMPVQYFPSLVCLIGYSMSYASGSALGTQGIIFPLVVPVIVHLTKDEGVYLKTVAAALSSTVFGNLSSPIADTTIAGVLFTECPMVDHIKVMSTFCIPLAIMTLIFGDLMVGLNLYPCYISYLITTFLVVVVFGVFGRQPGEESVVQCMWRKIARQTGKENYSESSEDNERTALLKKEVV